MGMEACAAARSRLAESLEQLSLQTGRPMAADLLAEEETACAKALQTGREKLTAWEKQLESARKQAQNCTRKRESTGALLEKDTGYLEKILPQLDEADRAYEQALREGGFAAEEEYKGSLLSPQDMEKGRGQLEKGQEALTRVRARYDTLQQKFGSLAAPPLEDLKARDSMTWVGLMNNCKAQAEEVILQELIYS